MRAATTAFVLAIMLLLGACGSDSDADRVSLELNESPINELLGIDIALRSGDLVQLERDAEAAIVECMLQSGFEYIAIDFASQFEPESGAENPDSRAYAEANGYGITIRPDFDAPAPQDLVDPNDAIRANLSPAELDEYRLALFGQAPAEDEPVNFEEQDGCVGQSYSEVYAAQAELGAVERFFGEFGEQLTDLENRFRSDPRFLELEQQWAACMADLGFPVATREEIFVELNRRMSDVAFVAGEEPTSQVQAEMDAVSDWERQAAVADWDCTQPVQDDMATLRYGYEALFLDENRDQIESDR